MNCPICENGTPGKDALCDKHYNDYLGTHAGSRSEEAEETVNALTRERVEKLIEVLIGDVRLYEEDEKVAKQKAAIADKEHLRVYFEQLAYDKALVINKTEQFISQLKTLIA